MEDSLRETLHDHYKETFQYIRERETLRDRLFLVLIGLYAVLAVQIQDPRKFDGSVETINLLGVQVDVSSLPLAALLSATWVFVLAVVLRYCQTTMNIERKYDYLHKVEGRLSPEFGDDVYCREGRAYQDEYPRFSDWTWRFYTVVLPVVAILSMAVLAWEDVSGLNYSIWNKILDGGVALYIIVLFFLFRVLSPLVALWGRFTSWLSQKQGT